MDFVDTEMLRPVRGECLSQQFEVEGALWPTGLPPLCGKQNDQHCKLKSASVNINVRQFYTVDYH